MGTFNQGQKVVTTSGLRGTVARPASSAAIQEQIYTEYGGAAYSAVLIVDEHGQVHRFLESSVSLDDPAEAAE